MLYSFSRYSCALIALAFACIFLVARAETLPAHVQALLDQHAQQLQILANAAHDQPHLRMGRHVHEMPWLPGYFIKYGVKRFYNAQKLKSIIQAHRLNLLCVAKKYLYHIPGRPTTLSDKNYLVIVKKVEKDISPSGDQRQILNLEQIQQLCYVALKARHYDLHTSNYILSKGKLVIIDTDSGAMPSEKVIERFDNDRLVHGIRIRTVGRMRIFNDPLAKIHEGVCPLHTHYNEAAKAYVMAQIKARNVFYAEKNKKRSAFLKFLRLA